MTKPFDIPKALVWEAYQRVKTNGGSAGVDRESIEGYESRLSDNLYRLWNWMCSGSYFRRRSKVCRFRRNQGVRDCWVCRRWRIVLHKRWLSRSWNRSSNPCFTATLMVTARGVPPWTRWPWCGGEAGSRLGD